VGAFGGTWTMGAVLEQHLRESGLPPDAGDSQRFAVVDVGLLPYPIPNTRSRKRAVRVHDLNHLVTGYATDREGELEISAWELASGGCGRYSAAWVLDLAGMLTGLLVCPRRVVRAFRRGRTERNLYPYDPEDLLAMDVEEARALVRTGRPSDPLSRLPAPAHLAVLALAAVPVAVVMAVAWWFLYPAWLVSRRAG
jgi:ubiquinone biosynthesis protein Coq4